MNRIAGNVVLVVLFWLLSLSSLQAHDPGLSTATLQLHPDRLDAVLVFSVADLGQIANLDRDGSGKPAKEQSARSATELQELALSALEVRFDGSPAPATNGLCRFDGNDNASVHLEFVHGPCTNLFVRSKWLTSLPPGHRQLLSLLGEGTNILAERLLSAASDSVTLAVDGTAQPEPASFVDFLGMGIKHIWTGYDHLLFLLGLLLVTRSFGAAVKVITCFTIAHSMTLAVATLSAVEFPPRIVEPLIAASIIYVGAENLLRRGEPKGRGWLAFAFGLIHGFGFATVLRELGVASRPGGVAMPLFSFNLGVELGQVVVAAVALPILWKLRTRPRFESRGVPACSAAIVLLGTYWFVQRLWM